MDCNKIITEELVKALQNAISAACSKNNNLALHYAEKANAFAVALVKCEERSNES